MSFNVSVTIKAGKPEVTMSGDVPDGELSVSGHETADQRSLTVMRRGPDGRYVQQANSVHYKEG